eukprot:TRINITY_DN13665_c0_g1_i1.p1 TRINITY_DN13665_c0_g1~~TRINITY_DN13665_c0_g1_i1.p1  ORF type:complete len:419 (+),score=78.49 TRINITY_DN13665_c0_g1_i1:72-1259(+)
MACIIGDETGLLKVCDLSRASLPKVAYQCGMQDRETAIMGLTVGRKDGEYVAVHNDGSVTLLRGAEGGVMPTHDTPIEGTILPCATPSSLYFNQSNCELSSIDDEGNVFTARLDETSDGFELSPLRSFTVKGPVSAVAFFLYNDKVCLAVGGRQNDTSVYNIQDGSKMWQAKELPHCSLGLRQKVFPAAVCLLGNNELFVATGHQELRRYDLESKGKKARPLSNWCPEWLATVRFFCAVPDPRDAESVYLADNTGSVYLVNVVKEKLVMKFKGISGCAREISPHPTLPFILTAGLSRRIYVHDVNTGKLVTELYLKQRLNVAKFLPADPFLDKFTHTEKGTTPDEANELWMDIKIAKKRKDQRNGTGSEQKEKKLSGTEPAAVIKRRKVKQSKKA